MTAPEAQPLPQGEEKAEAVRGLFDRIAGRYDLVNRVMTLGMDRGWRRRTVASLRLPGGSLVADLACGTGELQAQGYRPNGFDFSHGMLTAARTSAPLVEADVLRLPLRDASVDGATCGFAMRNVVSLRELFAELARVVRPGGRFALLETSQPDGALMGAGHAVYFRRVVPLIGGLLSDRVAYSYLPASTAYLPPTEDIVAGLRDAGFPDAERRPLSGGITQLFVGTRA